MFMLTCGFREWGGFGDKYADKTTTGGGVSSTAMLTDEGRRFPVETSPPTTGSMRIFHSPVPRASWKAARNPDKLSGVMRNCRQKPVSFSMTICSFRSAKSTLRVRATSGRV